MDTTPSMPESFWKDIRRRMYARKRQKDIPTAERNTVDAMIPMINYLIEFHTKQKSQPHEQRKNTDKS